MNKLFYLIITLVCNTIIVDGREPLQSSVKAQTPKDAFSDKRQACCSDPCSCPKKDSKNQCIAAKAAQEAKQAQDCQQGAAMAVARQVKMQLAQRALQAAIAAEAALNGKQAMVEHLECQVRDAQAVAQQELASCLQTQANLQCALNAAAQAGHLLKALTISLQISEANLATIQQTVMGSQHELATKIALYDAARCRAESLLRELYIARQELCYIKQAACRAMMAARNAQCNAQQRRRSLRSLRKSFNTYADVFQIRRPSAEFRKFSGKDFYSDKFCNTIIVDGREPLQSSVKPMTPEDAFFPKSDNKRQSCCPGPCSCPKKDSKNQCIAAKAAQEAKQAQDTQQGAAMAAARQVKMQLAQRALQAAIAAEAALNGKQAMVEHLECQVREAQAVAQQELASCLQTQANLQSALNAAAQAGHLLKALTISLQISEANLGCSQQTAIGIQHELANKVALYDAARCRAEGLLRELYVARQELCYIKQAACRAMMAAKNAQCNAQQRRRSLRSLKKSFNNYEDIFHISRPSVGYRKFSGKDSYSDKYK